MLIALRDKMFVWKDINSLRAWQCAHKFFLYYFAFLSIKRMTCMDKRKNYNVYQYKMHKKCNKRSCFWWWWAGIKNRRRSKTFLHHNLNHVEKFMDMRQSKYNIITDTFFCKNNNHPSTTRNNKCDLCCMKCKQIIITYSSHIKMLQICKWQ